MKKALYYLIIFLNPWHNVYSNDDAFLKMFDSSCTFYKLKENVYQSSDNDLVYFVTKRKNGTISKIEVVREGGEYIRQTHRFYPNGQKVTSFIGSIFQCFGQNPPLDDPSRWHNRKMDALGRITEDSRLFVEQGKTYSLVSKMSPKSRKVLERCIVDAETNKMVKRYDANHNPIETTEIKHASIEIPFIWSTYNYNKVFDLLKKLSRGAYSANLSYSLDTCDRLKKDEKETIVFNITNPKSGLKELSFIIYINGLWCFQKI